MTLSDPTNRKLKQEIKNSAMRLKEIWAGKPVRAVFAEAVCTKKALRGLLVEVSPESKPIKGQTGGLVVEKRRPLAEMLKLHTDHNENRERRHDTDMLPLRHKPQISSLPSSPKKSAVKVIEQPCKEAASSIRRSAPVSPEPSLRRHAKYLPNTRALGPKATLLLAKIVKDEQLSISPIAEEWRDIEQAAFDHATKTQKRRSSADQLIDMLVTGRKGLKVSDKLVNNFFGIAPNPHK